MQFELEQDNAVFDKDFSEMKSTKKKNEQNPVYGEDFRFNIPTLKYSELPSSCFVAYLPLQERSCHVPILSAQWSSLLK